jgi:hypothetical protein
MDRAEWIGSPEGAAVASLIFGAMAAFIGFAIARLLKALAAPPGEQSYLLTTPRARWTIGGLVTLAGLAIVWAWLWTGFYAATVVAQDVELVYLMPLRTEVIPAREIARVNWVVRAKGQRVLQIVTSSGVIYTSAAASMPAAQQDALRRQIEEAAARR